MALKVSPGYHCVFGILYSVVMILSRYGLEIWTYLNKEQISGMLLTLISVSRWQLFAMGFEKCSSSEVVVYSIE